MNFKETVQKAKTDLEKLYEHLAETAQQVDLGFNLLKDEIDCQIDTLGIALDEDFDNALVQEAPANENVVAVTGEILDNVRGWLATEVKEKLNCCRPQCCLGNELSTCNCSLDQNEEDEVTEDKETEDDAPPNTVTSGWL